MKPFEPVIPYGELVIDSQSLHTYAWTAIDIRSLYMPAAYRGTNVTIPALDGQRPYPYRIDQADHTIPMYFTGVCDPDGDEYPDRFVGYETNIGLFNTALLSPPTGGFFAAAILNTPSTTDYEADVQVLGFELGSTEAAFESPFVWRAALHLRVPAGQFTQTV